MVGTAVTYLHLILPRSSNPSSVIWPERWLYRKYGGGCGWFFSPPTILGVLGVKEELDMSTTPKFSAVQCLTSASLC